MATNNRIGCRFLLAKRSCCSWSPLPQHRAAPSFQKNLQRPRHSSCTHICEPKDAEHKVSMNSGASVWSIWIPCNLPKNPLNWNSYLPTCCSKKSCISILQYIDITWHNYEWVGQPKERGYRWSGDAGGIGGSCSQLFPFQLPLSGDTGSFPKSGDTGGFWSSKCLVPTVSGDMGGIWYLKSQFHGLSGALGGICNLGNGCQELSGDVGGICDLGSRIQDLSGDRGWNIRPVENKWKSSFYPWSTRIPATLVLWVSAKKLRKKPPKTLVVPLQ